MTEIAKRTITRLPALLIAILTLPILAQLAIKAESDKPENAIDKQSESATAIVNGCKVSGKISGLKAQTLTSSWSPLRGHIKIINPFGVSRKVSLFFQIVSQNSKSPDDAFVFREGT